jgi:hypothetical protein
MSIRDRRPRALAWDDGVEGGPIRALSFRPGEREVAMTSKAWMILMAIGVLALGEGCATTQQMLDRTQPIAMDTALRRGRFDLACPQATGVLLSDDFIQPAIQGPWVSGMERLEYTIGIEGCGKRTSIVVMCQEGSTTCFAANPNREFRNSAFQND